jgi:acetylornithine deacetylase
MLDARMKVKIMGAVDAGFDAQIELTAELVKIPSVRGEEALAQDFMAKAYAEHGLDADRWKIRVEEIEEMPGFAPVSISYDNSYNVVGAHRSSSHKGRSLILNGHVDVVPTGPLWRWDRSPWDPHIEDGWMSGRGAGDMKSGLVSCLGALDALRRLGYKPAADVYVQSVVEEECTGNGALACLQRGYRADAAFITEPMGPVLMRAQVGLLWFQVRVEGDPQHASGAYREGSNAIEKAFQVIQALKALEVAWNGRKGESPGYADHPHPIRFNLGQIRGGDWTSSVPAWCNFDMRIGIYPGWDLAEVKAEIEDCVREAAEKDPFLAGRLPQIVYSGFQAEGYVVEEGGEAEGVLARSHEAVFGVPLSSRVTSAATDARYFGLYGRMPTLVYGATCRSPHGFNEAVNLESVRKTTQTLALFIADWCGLESA